MSSSFWKVPRSNLQWVRQWCRRVFHPMPFILQEVNTRMLARAQIMRPTQGGVVHQGWVHPTGVMPLQTLFEDRSVSVCVPVLDRFASCLPKPKGVLSRWFFWDKANALNVMPVWPQEPLPFESETQALVWSPLWLHHVEDPQVQLQAWLRVLKPEGCVFLTCFGPDTAKELQAVAVSLGLVFPDFPDMHDWGDLLVHNGFSDPVVEMEKLTLTYSSSEALLDDWRALVGRNVLNGPKGLFGREAKQKALLALESQRDKETGRIALTLELVYAHAWKVRKQAKPAFASVRLDDIGGRKANRVLDGSKR